MWNGCIEDCIIYEDKEVLVCHKPAGIAVQNAKIGTMDLESGLKNYLAVKTKEMPYLGVVHRLDQPVEGLVVFAKTPRAARELSRQVSGTGMDKYYLAVTTGTPPERSGILEHYLKKDGRSNSSAVVSGEIPGAKRARLSYKVLKEFQMEEFGAEKCMLMCTLMEIHLETGRHHQIRVQMSAAGMPLLGDRKYHPSEAAGRFPALGLCSYKLSFTHPATKKKMCFECRPEGAAFEKADLK